MLQSEKLLLDEASIIQKREAGKIFVSDFKEKGGKYISTVLSGDDLEDVKIKISPKIEVRLTYLQKGNAIKGIKLAKYKSVKGAFEKDGEIKLSTLDFNGILKLLKIFSELDLESVANKSVILDQTIIQDPSALNKFLLTIAADPAGRRKLDEFFKSHSFLREGDIEELRKKRESVKMFDNLLNTSEFFSAHKAELKIGKDEEVWQRFFKENSWLLGSEFIEIVDERNIDEERIVDYFTKSYDGHMDIIELKLPGDDFWTNELNPNAKLTKALMQCMNYVSCVEKRINDAEFLKKIKNSMVMKPRITLIYGRSKEWDDEKRSRYRIYNSSLNGINIFTYDQILERAERVVGNIEAVSK